MFNNLANLNQLLSSIIYYQLYKSSFLLDEFPSLLWRGSAALLHGFFAPLVRQAHFRDGLFKGLHEQPEQLPRPPVRRMVNGWWMGTNYILFNDIPLERSIGQYIYVFNSTEVHQWWISTYLVDCIILYIIQYSELHLLDLNGISYSGLFMVVACKGRNTVWLRNGNWLFVDASVGWTMGDFLTSLEITKPYKEYNASPNIHEWSYVTKWKKVGVEMWHFLTSKVGIRKQSISIHLKNNI